MRIIEQQMLSAIFAKRNWRKSNTRVQYHATAEIVSVYLHENLIALIFPTTQMTLCSSAGYRTRTTKSRLNAILGVLCNDCIYQRHGVWYLQSNGWEFVDEPLEQILRGEIDARLELRRLKNDKNLFSA